jgi:hypothetical protein
MPVKGYQAPHLCKKCGETDPENFYGPRKTECKKCLIVRTGARAKSDEVYQRPSQRCKTCGEQDPVKFYIYQRGECKACVKKRTSKYQTGNKEFNRRRHLRRAYGITQEFYDTELAKQQGRCALCGMPPDETDLQKILVVDHDHETGEFRGLIHGRCNCILGYAKDDPKTLRSALEYLARHHKF